jgi:quinol monooxygenase YgiN
MIIVGGQMTLPPELIAEFEAAVAAMRPRVLAEAGCHHYSLLVEDAGAGLVNVYEIWDDDAALGVHLTQPWIKDFFARFGTLLTASTVVIHDIASTRPLPGM